MEFLAHLEVIAGPEPNRRCRPLADAVHCQHHRFLERRREEGTSGMTLMVFGEEEPSLPVIRVSKCPKLPLEQGLLEELLLEPHRDSHGEGLESAGGEGKVRLEKPLELQEWLVVERD